MSIDDQNNHPLYKSAHERFLRAEEQQNIKAAAKYPEPLNPASWSAEELGDHYAQESVDQGRYVEALVAKCKALKSAVNQRDETLNETNAILFRFHKALQLISEIDIWAGESAFAQATAEEALRGAETK